MNQPSHGWLTKVGVPDCMSSKATLIWEPVVVNGGLLSRPLVAVG